MMSNDQLDLKILDQLSPEERAAALEILQQYATSGKSDLLDNWQHADWDEIPVDIDTFLDDDKYLGRGIWSTDQDTGEKRCTLFPYWRNMLHKLFPDNQTTAYNTLILTGSIGLGKAQPLNSPVLTENGFKPMKDLTLKDKVFGNDGELHNILGIFPQGKKKVCRVTFSDKTSTECCDEHLWTVYNIDTGNQEVLETREILANGLTNNNKYKYRIPLTKPVNFIPKYKLKLSPYTLGERFSKNPDDLKDISDCLYSTISDRTELLQGILDNIGILSEDKTAIEVTNTNLNLKTTLNWLAQSLGGVCKANSNKLLIKLPAYSIPFKEKYKGQNLNIQQPARYIANIEYIEDQECQCIYIDSKDHLYLTNDFIVTHNTLVAVLAQLYLLYRMLCLKDPYEYFGLMPSDKITFSMLNITLDAAKGVGWSKLQQLVQGSEWFMNHGSVNASRTDPTWQPSKHIELIFGSNNNHVIGRALFSNFTDEANFSGGNSKNVDRQKEKLKKMIAQIDARMVSRFGKGTYKPTLNIIASSKDSEQSFLDSYIETKKKNESKTVLIIDEPQWVVRNDKGSPDDPGAFYVAVGGKFLPNELLPVGADEALVQSYRDKGYTTIIKVPPIYREDFETNLEQALMDDAGLASINSTKFLSGERLVAAKVDTYENPFLKDVIEVGDGPDDHLQYANFFDLSKVSAEDKARPLFIHLDMSTGGKGKGDKTGIAGVWITGKSPSVPGQDESLSLRYKLAFSVSIKAPRGFNISFIKNQNFIKWLKAQGFNIKGVSADTFQSASVLQELKAAGFNTSIISVDRVGSDKICAPYYYLKSAIYDRRVEIYRKCDLLTTELVNLERMSSGKIEHTEGGRYGSKDQSDGFCLDGDTEIFLLSGKHKTIRQLYEENNFKDEWVLGYNTETEMFEPCQIRNVLDNGVKNNVIKLTLDTGQELICTDDHKILARDGSYVEAKDTLGVSLMPFSHELRTMYRDRKYEYVYVPKHDLSSQGVYLHKLVAEAAHGSEKAAAKERCQNNEWVVIHHANCDKLNNNPENLQYLTNKEHSLVHCQLNSSAEKRNRLSEIGKEKFAQGISPLQHLTPEQKEKWRANNNARLIQYNKSEEHKQIVAKTNNRLAKAGLHPFQLNKAATHTAEANQKREKTCKERYGGLGFSSATIQQKCRANCLANNGYDNPFHSKDKQHKMQISKLMNLYTEVCKLSGQSEFTLLEFKLWAYRLNSAAPTNADDIIEARLPIDVSNFNKSEYEKLRTLGNCVKLFISQANKNTFTFSEFMQYFKNKLQTDLTFKHRFARIKTLATYENILKLGFNLYNHRVVKIETVAPREVYDIQLDKIHNFALTNGLIVHNCGALYNASLFASDYAYSYGESLASTFEVNMIDSGDMRKKQIINGIQDEIAKLYSDSNYLGYKKDADPKRQEELRRYQEIADGIIII